MNISVIRTIMHEALSAVGVVGWGAVLSPVEYAVVAGRGTKPETAFEAFRDACARLAVINGYDPHNEQLVWQGVVDIIPRNYRRLDEVLS